MQCNISSTSVHVGESLHFVENIDDDEETSERYFVSKNRSCVATIIYNFNESFLFWRGY